MANHNTKEFDSIINCAIAKIGGKKENELCKYLPVGKGGYIHHFTFRKMKHENPKGLADMINEYVIGVSVPLKVKPKTRAPRGSRKRRDQIAFSKCDLERLLHIARLTGDRDLVSKLSPKRSLASVKRDLIASIRKGVVDQDIWNLYVEVVGGCDFAKAQLTMTSNLPASSATLVTQTV